MKKTKKIWEENKVLLVLAIILLVCIVVIVVVGLSFFYGSSESVYGNRLDVTKETPLDQKLFNDIKTTLEEKENVLSTNVTLKGKIVYISIKYANNIAMTDAKKIAESAIELFNEEELKVYDIEFSISSDGDSAYTLMGARNAKGSGSVVWNNYNIVEESAN